eukprot:2146679-Rhodomonas_salina.3
MGEPGWRGEGGGQGGPPAYHHALPVGPRVSCYAPGTSCAVLKVVPRYKEPGTEKGYAGSRGRKMTAGTFMMLKRLVEAHKVT